jgi:hypothetical protein
LILSAFRSDHPELHPGAGSENFAYFLVPSRLDAFETAVNPDVIAVP